jgi:hypothetical protein
VSTVERVRLERAFHPLANIFPLMEGKEFAELVDDIRQHGLREGMDIVLYQSKILDGRNRYRACHEAGVEPRFTAYTGNDPLAYVVSLNLKRRHLTESQRAMVAAKLATMRQGERTDRPSADLQKVDRASAAKMLNVSERSVASAADVRKHGDSVLVHAVERGQVKVSAAADIATLSNEQQRELLARMDRREILRVAKELRSRNADGKRYWLTPPELMAKLKEEFGPFDFDPCPCPRPDGFDGLAVEWGQSNYVNPPFTGGITAWARKAIAEYRKGKRVVLVFPMDAWVLMLLEAGAQVRNLGNVKWLSAEDGTPGNGAARPIACFVLDGRKPTAAAAANDDSPMMLGAAE